MGELRMRYRVLRKGKGHGRLEVSWPAVFDLLLIRQTALSSLCGLCIRMLVDLLPHVSLCINPREVAAASCNASLRYRNPGASTPACAHGRTILSPRHRSAVAPPPQEQLRARRLTPPHSPPLLTATLDAAALERPPTSRYHVHGTHLFLRLF